VASTKIDMKAVLEERSSLAVFPAVVTEILRKVDDPETTPAMFQQIIMKDPLITAKTLKLANSAFYGYPREISTISEAIVILGLDTLRSLIIAISAYNVLNKEVKGYHYAKDDFWHHSLSTALITQKIARKRKFPNSEAYFIGGILHDIGKLLLDRFRYSHYEKIEEFSTQYKVPLYLAEKSVLGHSHADVGAALAEVWGFPAMLIEIIKFHHTPLSSGPIGRDYVKAVHIADILSNGLLGRPADPRNPAVDKEIGLTPAEEKTLIDETSQDLESFTVEVKKG
jgi:putative nucleotidyltransferase with HDIG domain